MPRRLAALMIVPLLAACAALSPEPRSIDDRLAAFPREDLRLDGPVTVRWNAYQVPWIEAGSDRDLAYTLGLVHMHLREAQMELMRRLAQGRLSSMFGPMTADIDAALRTLDFARVSAGVVDAMDPTTRHWVNAFVAGLNDYRALTGERPPEFGLLGIEAEPWRPDDVITLGRLAGTDVNWLVFFSLLEARLEAEQWPRTWRRALAAGGALEHGADGAGRLGRLLAGTSRSGSNTLVVGPERSATGQPLLAADPHLGLGLPNLWLAAGMRSPGREVVGLMVPGLPIVGVGRNAALAWGGTNLRNAASDLYDVANLPADAFTRRAEAIEVRFWFDREVEVRDSPLGPVVSDRELLPARDGEALALRWVGHRVSDEMGALLQASRARSGAELRRAFARYAVSGQHILYASVDGGIGRLLAARQPRRAYAAPPALVLDPDDPKHRWQGFADATDLPAVDDPAAGFLASANEQPGFTEQPMGWFYSAPDRMERLRELAGSGPPLDLDDLKALQRDTLSPPAQRLAEGLAGRLREVGLAGEQPQLVSALEDWDGDYAVDAWGPVAFETLLNRLARGLYGEDPGVSGRWSALQKFLIADLDALAPAARRDLLSQALAKAAADAGAFPDWGAMHRLRVGHWLAALPVLGSRFVLDDLPVGGSRQTLMKTAHDLVGGRHRASYGSQSRFLADLSDPDASWLVLLGGQDGWLGSANFADQLPLWREGSYLRMPLTAEGVRAAFPRSMELRPGR